MTRKDYELIAKVLAKIRPVGLIFFDRLVNEMADKLKSDNPAFDQAKFRKACYKGQKGRYTTEGGERDERLRTTD